jgi:hypothetical protein
MPAIAASRLRAKTFICCASLSPNGSAASRVRRNGAHLQQGLGPRLPSIVKVSLAPLLAYDIPNAFAVRVGSSSFYVIDRSHHRAVHAMLPWFIPSPLLKIWRAIANRLNERAGVLIGKGDALHPHHRYVQRREFFKYSDDVGPPPGDLAVAHHECILVKGWRNVGFVARSFCHDRKSSFGWRIWFSTSFSNNRFNLADDTRKRCLVIANAKL